MGRKPQFLLGIRRSNCVVLTPLEKLVLPETHLHQIQQDGRFVLGVANVFTRESLAENAVLRFTCILDLRLRARRGDAQPTEGWLKCMVLNRMVNFGIPKSERMS